MEKIGNEFIIPETQVDRNMQLLAAHKLSSVERDIINILGMNQERKISFLVHVICGNRAAAEQGIVPLVETKDIIFMFDDNEIREAQKIAEIK